MPIQPDPSKTVIVGLGNPILGDDGVGWRVIELIERRLSSHPNEINVQLDCLSVGGLTLMEHLVGFERAIIVDAIVTGEKPVGAVWCVKLMDISAPWSSHLGSTHDANLHTAIELGRKMGAELPAQIMVVGVETNSTFDFSEQLSPPVAAALPVAVATVMQLLVDSIY